tara:strand:+ start:1391 stop:2170 length:780 start_codon:yes stop_codon:yes gene_type:complete
MKGPRKLESWVDHYRVIVASENRVPIIHDPTVQSESSYVALPTVEVDFPDEFAPSRSSFGYSGEPIEGVSRSLFYGDDWGLVGEAAIARCCDFGLPHLWWPTLGFYTGLTETQFERIVSIWREIVEPQEEGSEDWTCLQVYFRLASLSRLYSEKAKQFLIFEEVFKLGALVRELQLVTLNKADALSRKKQKRSLNLNNEGRDTHNAQRKAQAAEWQSLARQIAVGTTLAGNARARWVKTQLANRYGISKAAKTIAAALR